MKKTFLKKYSLRFAKGQCKLNEKILFIDNDSGFTGSTISLGYLIKGFCNNNYDVFVLTAKSEKFSSLYVKLGAKPVFFRFPKMENFYLDLHFTNKEPVFTFRGFNKFIKNVIKFFVGLYVTYLKIKEISPDLLYLNEYVVIQSALAGYLMKIPTVTHVRSRYLKGTFGVRNYLLSKSLIKFNDLIFAISKQEADQIIKFYHTNYEKVLVVGEFLNEENFRNFSNIDILKKKFNLPIGGKIILMLGEILPIKGTIDFIKAAQIVIEKNENVCFVIAGKTPSNKNKLLGNYFKECMAISNLPWLKNSIRFTGEVSNTNELIACCDILVSPSTETHFSRPIIEAWAMKKAVIATETEHTKDLVEHNINGLIVKIGSPKEIAVTILKLLYNKELLENIGIEGYTKAFKFYNANTNLKIICEKCATLISKSKRVFNSA